MGPRTWRLTRPCSRQCQPAGPHGFPAHVRLDDPDFEPGLLSASRPKFRPILAFQSVPLVRRLTGGGAIWHHHEVTYALVVPADHPLARPSTGLYQAVHAAIARPCSKWEFQLAGAANLPKRSLATKNDPYYALLTPIRKIS